jgi:hypothetical protein
MNEENLIDGFVRNWALKQGVYLFSEDETFEGWTKQDLPPGQKEAYFENLLNQIQQASRFRNLPDVEELVALVKASRRKPTVMDIAQTWIVFGLSRSGIHFQEMPGDTEEIYWKRIVEQVARYLEEEELFEELMKMERRKG